MPRTRAPAPQPTGAEEADEERRHLTPWPEARKRGSLPISKPSRILGCRREYLDALGPAPRAELLHVLMLPDLERVERIGEFWSYPQSRTFAELLITCEEDRSG